MNIWDLVGQFWEEHKRAHFSPYAGLLYFFLIEEANRAYWKGPLSLSWNFLQQSLGCSRDTLGRAISDLKSRKLIDYDARKNKQSKFWFPGMNKFDSQTDNSNKFDNQTRSQTASQTTGQTTDIQKTDNSSESEGPLRQRQRQEPKILRQERAPSEKDGKPNYIQLIEKALRDQMKEPHRIIPVIIGQRDPSDYPFLLWLIKTTDLAKVRNPVAYLNSFFMDDQQSFEKRTQFQEMQGILHKARAAKAAREFEKVIQDAY